MTTYTLETHGYLLSPEQITAFMREAQQSPRKSAWEAAWEDARRETTAATLASFAEAIKDARS